MIIKKIHIDIYGWTIHYTEVEEGDKGKSVIKHIRKIISGKKEKGLYQERFDEIKGNVDHNRKDGGLCSYWIYYRKTSVLIYRTTKRKERIKVIAHELRHVVDQILETHGIYDREAAAYLQGYIFMKLYKG